MIKYISLVIFLVSAGLSDLKAQQAIRVTQQEKQMSRGVRNGFMVEIPQAKLKDVVNAWKKYISRGDAKPSVEASGDEYQVKGTVLSNISANPMNVYAIIKEAEKVVRITAYFAEDDSVFISSSISADKTEAIEKLLKDFARLQYRLAVENELGMETKKVANLEDAKENLINANEKANKNISEYERKIDRARKEIETNSLEQSTRRSEVAGQKEIVRTTTPKTETYEVEEKKLNGLEKELKKLEKKGESLHSDIDDWNADIRQVKRDIEKTEDKIKEKTDAISQQKEHVKGVRKKMENIK